jgi:hypothetical protein
MVWCGQNTTIMDMALAWQDSRMPQLRHMFGMRSVPLTSGAVGNAATPPAHPQWWHRNFYHATSLIIGVILEWCATIRLTPISVFLVVLVIITPLIRYHAKTFVMNGIIIFQIILLL